MTWRPSARPTGPENQHAPPLDGFFDQNGSPIQNSVIGTSQNWAASKESNGPQYGSRWNSNPAALSLSLNTL